MYCYCQRPSVDEKAVNSIRPNSFSNNSNKQKRKPAMFMRWLFALLLMAGMGAHAQSTANYTFSTVTTGSLAVDRNSNTVDMTTGTTTIVAADLDDNIGTSPVSIGFDFYFYGLRWTQFSATSNGIITLGSTAPSTTLYAISSGSTTTPRLSPFAADLRTGAGGKVHYKVVGTAPNRCLVIEFNNMSLLYVATPGSNDGTYQARFYESGIVEYVYGAMSRNSGTSASTSTVGIGFSVGTAVNTTASVTSSSNGISYAATFNTNTYTAGSGAITNLNSAANGSRRVYTFIPPGNTGNTLTTTLAAPTALNFTAVSASAMTVNWTASAPTTGVLKYAIYNSTDGGTTYNFVNTTTVGTNTLAVTGLTPSTTYTWKVIAISEGGSSAALTGSQATGGPQTYVWNQTGSASFGTPANWTPARSVPDVSDILTVDGSLTPNPTITTLTTQTVSQFKLLNSANVTVTSAAAATLTMAGAAGTDLDIPSGSTLNFSGTNTIGIAFGTGSQTANIAGTLTYSGSGPTITLNLTNCVATVTGTINLSTTTNAVTLTGVSATSLLMNAGSNMNLTTIQTVIPLATWAATSNLNISVPSTGTFTNTAQTFGNFTYNSSSLAGTQSFWTSTTTGVIQGNLNVQQTGTGSGRFRLLTTGTLVVNGNINITNSVNVTAVDLMNGAASLTVGGNVNVQNGSTCNFANGAGTLNITGSVTISNTAAVNFGNAATGNTTTISGDLNLNSTGTCILSNTSGTAIVVNVAGNFSQTAGTFTVGTSAAAGTLKVAGTFNQSGGTINSTSSAASTIEFNGASLQNVTLTSAVTGLVNFRLNNVNGINLTGTLDINNGASYTVTNGTTTGSGSIVYNATASSLIYNSTNNAQTADAISFPGTNGPVTFVINNTNASPNNTVTLPFARTTGSLTLTAGILVTSSSNLLTLSNSATTAITGGSASTYVRGALARTIAASLAGASTYNFPLGSTTYNLIQVLPTTGAGTSVVQFESFDGATGGSPDLVTLVSLNNDRYWLGDVISGGANFTSTVIKLTDATYGTQARMAQSATLAGTYAAVSPAPVSNVLTSSSVTSIKYITVGQFGTLISGTKTVCSSGCDYTSLTLAGGAFESLNNAIVNGNVNLEIAGNLTSETGLNGLNAFTSPYTVKIYPTGTTRTISGTAASAALIKLNGADRVTIDGSIGGTGTDRSLTITNTGATTPTAISIISLGTGAGAVSNTVKNCNISTALSTGIGYGIAAGGSTPGTSGADNDDLTIQNNNITVANVGIYANGTSSSSTGGNNNLLIAGNTISSTTTTIANIGIQAGNSLNSSITQNTVSVENAASTVPVAISLETGFVSSSVTRNNITKALATNTGGYGGRGITVGTGTASSALTIANNFISGINGTNWSSFSNASSMGIAIGMIGASSTITTTAGGINLYYNSVNMTGTYSSTTACLTTALYVGSGASALDIRNNIFVNSLNNTGTGSSSKAYSIYSAAANTAFSTINYNDYYVSGTQAVLGYLTSDRTNLAGIVTGFGGNSNSVNIAPVFTSSSDLHLVPASNISFDNLGTNIAAITNDYDNDTRNATTPDLGADEFSPPSCTDAVGGTASGSTSFCGSGTPAITASGYSTGIGSGYQWYSSTNISDYPNAGTAVSGQTNPATLTTGAVSVTTYFWLRVTCTSGIATDNSTMVTITINPIPTASASSNTPVCSGNTLNLTGSTDIGTSYSWTGPNSFSSSSQSPSITNVTTAATGTYTFTATLNGCTSAPATTSVVINPTPTALSITPASANICIGAIQQLTASGGNTPVNTSLINQNFNGANDWTTANASTGGTPASAAWTLRANGYVYSTTTFNSNDASQFYMSNSDAQGSSGTTSTTLTSPTVSTVDYSTLSLTFYHYFRYNASPDQAIVEVSTNGGGAWTPVQTYTSTQGSASGFVQATVNLNSYVGNATVQVRFRYSAPYGYYWAIDNVVLSGLKSTQGPIVWTPNGTGNGLYSDNTGIPVYSGAATPTVYASPTSTTTYTATSTVNGCSSSSTVTVTIGTADITATAGANGSISPAGLTTINCGTNQTYTITPDACYSVADVVVDGISQGATTSYTFTNTTSGAHTIAASFVLNTYNISVSAGTGGSISPASGAVNCGDNATYTITPDACYSIADVVVDGVSQGALTTYTFNNVQAIHSISATFTINTHTITVTAGSNGSISPSTGSVNCGSNATYTITPDACYSVADVIVDGVSQGALTTYTFSNVTAPHSISATF
ncbi:MAG: fibronectin type III domain-containing protein, partial [Bacteroidetes bacterium]|nr:fibronectin type III domain-containing protein [Bacteroidota bacterium]